MTTRKTPLLISLALIAVFAAAPLATALFAQATPPEPEKTYTALLPGAKKVEVKVYSDLKNSGGQVLKFGPPVRKNEANIHMLSLRAMQEIYPHNKGHFGPKDVTVGQSKAMGRYIVFKVKPAGRFCVFPLTDKKGQKLKGMRVWME